MKKYLSYLLKKFKVFWKVNGELISILFLIYIFLVLILPRGTNYDGGYWIHWIQEIQTNGLVNIYQDKSVAYLPFLIYIIDFVGTIIKVFFNNDLSGHIYLLKFVGLLFDIGSIFLTFKILEYFKIKIRYFFIFLVFNIAFFYDTIIWGQFDGTYAFFLILAVYFYLKNRFVLTFLASLLAIDVKPQAIIFLPIFFLLLLKEVLNDKRLLVRLIISSVILELLIFAPFLLTNHFSDILSEIASYTTQYPYVSVSAYNLWVGLKGINIIHVSDLTNAIGSLSYKALGFLLFWFAMLGLLTIFSIIIFKNKIKEKLQDKRYLLSIICLVISLLSLSFFMFNTQMHERYAHVAVVFAGIYLLLQTSRYSLSYFLCLAIAYVLNLDSILKYFNFIQYPENSFFPYLISDLFFLALALGIILILNEVSKIRDLKKGNSLRKTLS